MQKLSRVTQKKRKISQKVVVELPQKAHIMDTYLIDVTHQMHIQVKTYPRYFVATGTDSNGSFSTD